MFGEPIMMPKTQL